MHGRLDRFSGADGVDCESIRIAPVVQEVYGIAREEKTDVGIGDELIVSEFECYIAWVKLCPRETI